MKKLVKQNIYISAAYLHSCTYSNQNSQRYAPLGFAHAPAVADVLRIREGVMDTQNRAAQLNADIRSTIEQLARETDAARQSELFTRYLRTSAAFWDYSWHNQMLIWRQCPNASFVGGFHTWQKCGRYVRRGEKGIAILAPMFFKDKTKATDGSDTENTRIWFKVVYVFDISQTDGSP
ncbi:MAG TPA: ArdC family protein, partial [Candidatus Sulfotelmatobacter sp.]